MLELPVVNFLHLHPNRTSFILYGFITEGCVRHTCLDLLDRGHHVTVLVDGVGSIFAHEREVALEAMREAGATLSTSDSL